LEPRPFLKWAGGKQLLAKVITAYFPPLETVKTYYEPFLGGGAVFFTYNPPRAILNDANRWLMDTWRAIRDDWKRVASILDTMPNTKAFYLKTREKDPWKMDLYERAATLIYLNKTCFRGLFRVNREGKFNVPYGAYNRRYYDPRNLDAVSRRLRQAQVEFRSTDFELAVADITPKDFVYFDPPYYPIGGFSDFKRYTPEQFREHDHARLAAFCAELHERGIRWAVSNSNTSFVRALYKPFHIYEIQARREINLNSRNRDITELLITNVAPEEQQRWIHRTVEPLPLAWND